MDPVSVSLWISVYLGNTGHKLRINSDWVASSLQGIRDIHIHTPRGNLVSPFYLLVCFLIGGIKPENPEWILGELGKPQ